MSDPSTEQQEQEHDQQGEPPRERARKPDQGKPQARNGKDEGKNEDKDKDEGKEDAKGKDDAEGKDNNKKSDGKDEGKDGPSPEKKRKIRIILIAAAVVLAIAGIAWFIWHEMVGKYHESTDDAYIQADAVTISPKIGGYVDKVMVGENQDVAAGQPLIHIDPRDYRAQTEQYEAQIQIARANADTVRAQIAEQESAVAAARAQLAAARANAAFASGEANRYAPLVAIGAETAEQLAARRNQAKQGADQVAAQRAALANAEKRINTLRAQVRQAEAQGGAAAAQLKAAQNNLESTTISSSIGGRVGDLTVRLGQFVQPGARLMSVVPVGQIYIEANFKETQIGLMRVGQPVRVKVDALSGVKLRGHVESISPGTGAQFSLLPPQNATGNFTKIVQRVPVRIALEADPDMRQLLVPGLSVKVEVETKGAKDQVDALKDRQKDESRQIKKGDEAVRERLEDQRRPLTPEEQRARADAQAREGR